MKRLLLCAILAFAALPALGAQPAACPPYDTPITLNFNTLNPSPVYNNRLNVEGIRKLFAEHTERVAGPHQRALGITYALTAFSLQGSTSVRQVSGGYCIYIEDVAADFGFKRMNVFVASEFKPGTCEYRTILDHENQHVSVNTRTLKEFAPHFRAALENALATEQPRFVRAMPPNADASFRALKDKMSDYLDHFQKLAGERNAPLDSANNYGETAKLCKNWDGVSIPSGSP